MGDRAYSAKDCWVPSEELKTYWRQESTRLKNSNDELDKDLGDYSDSQRDVMALRAKASVYQISFREKIDIPLPIYREGLHIHDDLNPRIKELRRENSDKMDKHDSLKRMKKEIQFLEKMLSEVGSSEKISA